MAAVSGFALMSDEERAEFLSIAERLALAPARERRKIIRWLERTGQLEEFIARWRNWARPGQLPPDGEWRIWLLMAGRGYGKTRAGAEWVHHLAEEPGRRIAIVAATEEEGRRVMIEGASGLVACAADDSHPEWEPSRGTLTWPSGAQAFLYSGANPEGLRGPEHDYAWCDEIAKWTQPQAAWDNLMFGLRRGRYPRALATTTPRPIPLLRALLGRADVAVTSGRTRDNAMLAQTFIDYTTGLYAGTRLGRQELDGELIEDLEGALWTREMVEKGRVEPFLPGTGRWQREALTEGARHLARGTLHQPSAGPPPRPGEDLKRIIVGVDPPASAGGDACGIVVCGVDREGLGYVLDDRSARGMAPEGWAREVVRAAQDWGAERVVAETNQGGEMVESVLRSVDSALPVRPARARYGKGRRAEPVSALFARGKAKFAGVFAELEDELCGMTSAGYEGPGRSPDRADAMVWAMSELMLGVRREPRIRFL
jgi:phage terminase large subunit-like protein